MPLIGQAKTDYQREYMRKRRMLDPSVRPAVIPDLVDTIDGEDRPTDIDYIDADGCPVYDV